MWNLFIIFDSITNGFSLQYIHILHMLAILLGILTIVNINPVVSVLFLIGLFVVIAGILILIGYNFLGLAYILVYVGAVSILFLFILMLINIRVSELFTDTNNDLPLSILTIIYFYYIIGQTLPVGDIEIKLLSIKYDINSWVTYHIFNIQDLIKPLIINYVSSKNWDNSLIEPTHIASIGNILYTSYSIWLIVTSIILLLGMVGAIMITIKKK